jgi:hypothetical protein
MQYCLVCFSGLFDKNDVQQADCLLFCFMVVKAGFE